MFLKDPPSLLWIITVETEQYEIWWIDQLLISDSLPIEKLEVTPPIEVSFKRYDIIRVIQHTGKVIQAVKLESLTPKVKQIIKEKLNREFTIRWRDEQELLPIEDQPELKFKSI